VAVAQERVVADRPVAFGGHRGALR
jgi:hypothetical protein